MIQNRESQEYKDSNDRVILNRVQYGIVSNARVFTKTYHVYDAIGNLISVLLPEAARALKSQFTN
jgi:hypothetical protein